MNVRRSEPTWFPVSHLHLIPLLRRDPDNYGNTMITSIFIVLKGNVNPGFPSLPMHTLLSSKFPGKFCWKQPALLDEGKLEDKEIFCLLLNFLLNFPVKFRRQKRTSSKVIGTTMDSVWRHRPVHIRTITLPVFIPQSWTFQLRDKIRFMRMPKKNELSSHNHKTILNSIQIRPTHHARYPRWS
jgi:hypothetical protein